MGGLFRCTSKSFPHPFTRSRSGDEGKATAGDRPAAHAIDHNGLSNCAGFLVRELHARPFGGKVLVAPGQQHRQYRSEITALFGENVFMARGLLAVAPTLQDAVFYEVVEASCQHVRRNVQTFLEFIEPLQAIDRVADDENVPPLAHGFEASGNGALGGAGGLGFHGQQHRVVTFILQVTRHERPTGRGSGIISRPLPKPEADLRLSPARLAALFSTLASVCMAQTPPPVGQAVPLAAQTPPLVSAKALAVQDAWVRATPGADIAAAYMTLRNSGPAAITVTSVESPLAGHAMIHETRLEAGQSKMRPHEQLIVAPGATVKLEPGGLHIMLHDLKQPLSVGAKVPLVIQLAGGGSVAAMAIVRPLSAE
jgi:periplasmic copper chaperone A